MTKPKKQSHPAWPPVFALLGLFDLAVLMALLLRGKDISLLHPKGLIAQDEFHIIVFFAAALLSIAIPSVFCFYFFAWKYRETNEKAGYEPERRRGKFYVFAVWVIPTVFLVGLSIVMWVATHKLDPHTPIASTKKPLIVQVIALRWKWLFIYPAQHVAAVNYVQIPVGTPVQFELTADDAPMSSFWIPHLGGQLYAMTGMINTLNLRADTLGDYQGSSPEINGAGFAGMKFIARASTQDEFNKWVQSASQSYESLDATKYQELLRPSENNPPAYYSNPRPGLYDTVVMKYMGSGDPKAE